MALGATRFGNYAVANLTFSVGVRLDQEVHLALKEAATADGRSLSALIAKICAEWVRNQPVADQPVAGNAKPVTDWIGKRPKIRTRRRT